MPGKYFLVVFVVVLGLIVPVALAAGSANLTGSLEAYRVVVGDKGVENFLPADNARPTDTIEYRLVYTNTGDDPIQNVLITDPIPIGTKLVHPSALHSKTGKVEFSIDGGKNFQPWPILIKKTTEDSKETVVEATPDMVTHIRWALTQAIQPDGSITLTYRAVVK
jgi:uncharacterized repeat protein (TIGR01451 family)